jgi:hypothetical protein
MGNGPVAVWLVSSTDLSNQTNSTLGVDLGALRAGLLQVARADPHGAGPFIIIGVSSPC